MNASSEQYRELVDHLAKAKINKRFSNGLPEHAAIVLEAAFKYAQHSIRIYSGALHQAVYDQPPLINAAARFLRSSNAASLMILLQQRVAESSLRDREFFRVLADRPRGCGDLAVGFANGVYATDEAKHFCVIDDCGYRFELNHARMEAIANFNEPEIAGKLIGVFDRVMAEAEHVVIT